MMSKTDLSPMAAKKKSGERKACWEGYTKQGTKKKGGKTVNNCVKKKGR